MRLLVLGGTVFVGRHLVQEALARGHKVTLFHRGRRNPELFPEAERVLGDRDGGLAPLSGRTFDAVLDVSGYVPRVVRQSARRFAGEVALYAFVSTVSVYADRTRKGLDESAPVARLDDPEVEVVDARTYGGLKALCELEVEQAHPDRALVLRPGLVAGPHDPTDRFTYWPRRVGRGGEVLAPVGPDEKLQFVDARDLARFAIEAIEQRRTGTFNVVRTPGSVTFGALLDTCREVTGSDARVTWVDGAFLLEQGVRPFVDVPLWVAPGSTGFSCVSNDRARAAGFVARELAATVRDTWAWDRARISRDVTAGLEPSREREVLAAWHARRPPP